MSCIWSISIHVTVMSSSDDSETAEWEREQMARGTQSRARYQQQQQPLNQTRDSETTSSPRQPVKQNSDVIDANQAKNYVNRDIELAEAEIETTKTNIGSTIREISRTEKRIDAMMKQIEKLEVSNPFYERLQKLKEPDEVLALLNEHRQLILRLPHDQREMIDLLEGRMKDSKVPMSVDD